MECPYCKTENRDGVRYCGSCGKSISTSGSSTLPTATVTSVSSSTGAGTGGGISGSSRSLAPGARLQGGRYEIKKVLGQGGMGAALLATDRRLDNKSVVIKELLSDTTDPTKLQGDGENFRREMATLAHLDHHLVPKVTDYFQEGPHYFMVQEYVEGENLEERMDRLKQPLKEREALGYASEVLDVLEYLTEQSPPIVHRDIKPANIIVGAKEKQAHQLRAHLVDFGIARADVARKQTSALGTPGYAPPEQYQGKADPRSDLYALGATLHHVLTGRDPRNYSPFVYPPVRTLNSQLSPDIERVLTRALTNETSQRYQSATAMKQDINEILFNRFGVSGNTSSYTLDTSGPMTATGTNISASILGNQPTVANTAQPPWPPTQRQDVTIVPPPPLGSSSAIPTATQGGFLPPPPIPPIVGSIPPRPRQPRRRHFLRNMLLVLLILLLLAGGIVAALIYLGGRRTTANGTPTPTLPVTGIGAIQAPDGETIGISDGSVAFDTSRPSGNDKKQAAIQFQAKNYGGAEGSLQIALQKDSKDAEALIYQENLGVINSGSPYITIIVGTMLSGDSGTVSVGDDDLQGAYVAQKEYNDGHKLGNVLVRLLVANSGNRSEYATTVAQQIVLAVKNDPTIIGVMGWPFSSRALKAIAVLDAAHIPMVSQTASDDGLTNKSHYFFRVAPPNRTQGIAGAHYAEQMLHAKQIALFVDPLDPYSNSLAKDFSDQFLADGNSNQIVATEHYTVGKPGTLPTLLQDALSHAPDMIYFSGYAADMSTLLTNFPTSGPFATLPVLGGDALYELGGYGSSSHAAGFHLHFTTFAYPDEWKTLCSQGQTFACSPPAFFGEYSSAFDPSNQHVGTYGYSRADGDAILSYDAMLALLNASHTVFSSKASITPDDLRNALAQLQGSGAFQGVSGQISIGSDGDPVNKAIVVLRVDQNSHIILESVLNCFQLNKC